MTRLKQIVNFERHMFAKMNSASGEIILTNHSVQKKKKKEF